MVLTTTPNPTAIPQWIPRLSDTGAPPPGDFRPSPTDFVRTFVDDAVSPGNRREILGQLKNVCSLLISQNVSPITPILFNGSFTTSHRRPNDIDFVLLIDLEVAGTSVQSYCEAVAAHPLANLRQTVRQSTNGVCDIFLIFVLPDSHPLYRTISAKEICFWTGKFGRDRRNREKGRLWLDLLTVSAM